MRSSFLSLPRRPLMPTKGRTAGGVLNALRFPSNVSGSDTAAPFVALQFLNPQSSGLPVWGPSGAGITMLWETTPIQQTGYHAMFWWSNNGEFLWNGGGSNTYWGCHPYPQNGANTGTTKWWELAGMDSGSDTYLTNGGTNVTVVNGVKKTQGFRITHNNPGGVGTKTGRFYIDLPSVAAANILEKTSPSGWGDTDPPSPAFTIGDSPWYASFQHERASTDFGRVKIIAKVLTEADMVLEAADMTKLVTSDGIANIWWGKTNWRSVDDLTCDYGTGRAFTWASATKGTLVTAP